MSSSTILSRELSSAERTSFFSSPIQKQIDGLVSTFIQEAFDPRVLAAMSSAGMAYRLGRIGVMELGSSVIYRPLSVVAGFASEVTAFEFTNRTLQTFLPSTPVHQFTTTPSLWSWSGPIGWKQGLFTSAITFGMLKSAGFLTRGENIVLQHTFQSTAMVAGHQTASLFHLISKPEGSLPEQLLHAEVANLQLIAGMQLAYHLAPEIHGLERGLDLSFQQRNFLSLFSPGGPPRFQDISGRTLALSLGGNSSRAAKTKGTWKNPTEKDPILKENLLPMSYDPDQAGGKPERFRKYRVIPPLPPFQQQNLREKWKLAFARNNSEKLFSKEIIERVLKIRSSNPGLHEKILEVFNASPKAGAVEQFEVAERLQWLFNFNALASSTGSFENAVLQFLIERAARDGRAEKGKEALRLTLKKMEGSPQATEFVDLIRGFHYDRDLKISDRKITSSYGFYEQYQNIAASEWKDLQDPHKILLFNYVARSSGEDGYLAEKMIGLFVDGRNDSRYSQEDFDLALEYARRSPLTELVLDRMLHLFITQDHPSKLTELSEDFWPDDPLIDIPQWIAKGAKPEEAADRINGTRYTAYVNDAGLAEKIVSVALEASDYLKNPRKTEDSQAEFHQALLKELKKSQPLSVSQMMSLFVLHPTPLALRIYYAWRFEKSLSIQFVTKDRMSQESKPLGEIVNCQNLFKKGENGMPDSIFLQALPPFDLSTREGEAQSYVQWGSNFSGLAHEGGHMEHAPFRSIHRHDRIVSEMLSNLEEFNWDIRNLTNHYQKMGRGLGNRLPLFLRSLGEHNNFRRNNERLVREFFKVGRI